MLKIEGRIKYTKQEKRFLKQLIPLKGGEWRDLKNKQQGKRLKESIREQLDTLQNGKCAYCGLDYNATSGPEIEHIAPKGGEDKPMYPQYTFTCINLVLSCHLCNGFRRKGTFDTILKLNKNYRKCRFKIVHPYINNYKKHFGKVNNSEGIVLIPKSKKGKNSIELFGLNDTARIEARAKDVIFNCNSIKTDLKATLDSIQTYRKI